MRRRTERSPFERSHAPPCGSSHDPSTARTTSSLPPLLDLYVHVKQSMRVAAKTRERTWTVGELAEEFGVTTRTLRFYEAEGLIAPERRGSARGYHPPDHGGRRL